MTSYATDEESEELYKMIDENVFIYQFSGPGITVVCMYVCVWRHF